MSRRADTKANFAVRSTEDHPMSAAPGRPKQARTAACSAKVPH